MALIRMQPGVILKTAGLLSLKGYLTFLTKTSMIVFYILTQDMFKEVENVFNMNS